MQNPTDPIRTLLYSELTPALLDSLPKCHNVAGLITDKFIRLRMHIVTNDYTNKRAIVSYYSKSAFQWTAAANVGRF